MLNDLLANLRGRYGRPVDLPQQVADYKRIPPTVLYDLAEFCGAVDPAPIEGDMFRQGRAAGRRDVWLRIQHQMNLTAPEVYHLLKGEFIVKQDKEFDL